MCKCEMHWLMNEYISEKCLSGFIYLIFFPFFHCVLLCLKYIFYECVKRIWHSSLWHMVAATNVNVQYNLSIENLFKCLSAFLKMHFLYKNVVHNDLVLNVNFVRTMCVGHTTTQITVMCAHCFQ